MSQVKNNSNITPQFLRQLQRMKVPYHSSAAKLKLLLKTFHGLQLPKAKGRHRRLNDTMMLDQTRGESAVVLHHMDFTNDDTSTIDIDVCTNNTDKNEQCDSISPPINEDDNVCKTSVFNEETILRTTPISIYTTNSVLYGIQEATKFLVCTSAFQKVVFKHRQHLISMEKIAMFLNISKLLFVVGKGGQESLISLLQLFWLYLPISDDEWLPLPHNSNMFQSHILNRSNSRSLISQLPIPSIAKNNQDEHCYCNLSE